MSSAQIVIFGGGGIFQDHHPFRRQALFNPSENDISAYGRFIHLAQQYNRPVVLLGLGLGPLRSDEARQITCDLYERVARFTLRDEASAELLRDIGVKRPILVAPDIGWSYAVRWAREHLPLTTESSSPKLAIVLRHWDGEALWQERLAEALTGCIPPTWQIELVGFQQSVGPGDVTSDEPTLVRMAERLKPIATTSIRMCPSQDDALDVVAEATAVISMRFHASLIALVQKKPLMALEYDLKMVALHDSVGMPKSLRVGLTDSAENFKSAVCILMQEQTAETPQSTHWAMSEEAIQHLANDADLHRTELALALQEAEAAEPVTPTTARVDWLALWAESLIDELKLEKLAVGRAHELLIFHQHMMNDQLRNIERKLDALISAKVDSGGDVKAKSEVGSHSNLNERSGVDSTPEDNTDRLGNISPPL